MADPAHTTNANPYEQGPFRHVSDMENLLSTARNLVSGIAFIAETLDEDEASVVQRIAWLARRELDAAEELRGQLFRLTHPSREHFEREDWPS